MVDGVAHQVIDAVDDDGDGALTLNNWRSFYTAFQITDTSPDEVFKRLDLNGDGKLTRDEALTTVRHFFYSEDQAAPGNWFLGAF